MPTTYVTTDLIGSGDLISDDVYDSSYVILPGVTVGSTDGTGAKLTSSGQDLVVQGTLSGDDAGAALGTSAFDFGNTLTVAVGGLVWSNNVGVRLTGGATVSNQGTISGEIGVLFANSTASRMDNTGLIKGNYAGVDVTGSTAGATTALVNHGIVVGGASSYLASTLIAATDIVTNRGTLDGYVQLGAGNDVLDTRRGEVIGTVQLDDGDDRLDARDGEIDGDVYGGNGDDDFDLRGSLVTGLAYGDAGNDTFRPGAGDESIDGGAGADALDFRGSPGLRVSLADDSGTGLAEGDSYVGIETVLGSRGGADSLVGNGQANTLRGFGGDDALAGGKGDDVLEGGTGADTLTGGNGNDAFQFLASNHGPDLLQDFSALSGNDDRIEVSASGFGAGLAVGALAASQFQSRPDNLAQDGNDRFIFRTTDQTLWFDSNGNAGGGLVLLADLQSGATLTAADILVVA